jgi:L-ascorbate metabolism protein UlaG (beta-lactamase superfamily)
MIPAFQKDEQLLQDIYQSQSRTDVLNVWWLGQSGFLLQWQGKHLLFDPYLSDSLTHKYAQTDKPHIRMSELVVQPEKLDCIDVITSSHNHTDHLDGETLKPLLAVNSRAKLIIPEANREFVAMRLACDPAFPMGLNEGESTEVAGFRFHGIPAAHNELARDEAGRCKFMGYVVQFGPWTVYHSGDTLWHEEIMAALQPFDTDLAILPINGNKPERRVAGNLNAAEAVELSQLLGIKNVIPCHYHMFTFNTVEPDEFVSLAEQRGIGYKVLRGGEKWRLG